MKQTQPPSCINEDPLGEACLLCGAEDYFIVTNQPRRIVQCKNCSFVYASPRPSQQELSHYYSEAQTSTHCIDRRLGAKHAARRLKYLQKVVDFSDRRSILDIGCDDGTFLSLLGSRYEHLDLFGVEPSQQRAKLAKALPKLNIWAETFEETHFERTFDVIMAIHVLEHLCDPIGFLNKVKSIMHPESLLYIEVPTVSLSRLDLPCGMRLLAPGYRSSEHLWFFTKQTLHHLLEKQDFHIRAIKCVSFGVQPKVNSLVMSHLPWLFPLYELISAVLVFPFSAIGRGLQVMAVANKA